MNKCPEGASVVQQVYKAPSDIENLVGCTPDKVGECTEWTSVVRSAENRVNFRKALDGSALYGIDTVTLDELEGRPEGECTGRTKLCSEQNLVGINGSGRLPGSEETQEAYI
jgi:hypothetical protein